MAGSALLTQVNPLITAAVGLVGVGFGGFLTSWNQRRQSRERFALDQLREFYAPMLGIRERLRAKNEVRLKVSAAANAEWPRLMSAARETGTLRETRERLSPEFEKIIEYENRQLKEELIPLYKQMLDLFTAKMHLAEPSTRTHFSALVDFIEIWERSLSGALPREVVPRVGANEETLMSFYTDLQTNFERLQASLKLTRFKFVRG
jgi:hypothetical protein